MALSLSTVEPVVRRMCRRCGEARLLAEGHVPRGAGGRDWLTDAAVEGHPIDLDPMRTLLGDPRDDGTHTGRVQRALLVAEGGQVRLNDPEVARVVEASSPSLGRGGHALDLLPVADVQLSTQGIALGLDLADPFLGLTQLATPPGGLPAQHCDPVTRSPDRFAVWGTVPALSRPRR